MLFFTKNSPQAFKAGDEQMIEYGIQELSKSPKWFYPTLKRGMDNNQKWNENLQMQFSKANCYIGILVAY